MYNVDCQKIYILSVSTCEDSSWELLLPTGPKVPPNVLVLLTFCSVPFQYDFLLSHAIPDQPLSEDPILY